ncbi:glutamate ABC transporter substrate-binding protein [Streptomyces odonnellii]|uniref:glutamate ABC transporter substrate-binding protein n=1 Tax=Streptomyces odonnellii TaxID=1417980 RepID=UPI00099C5898|nr:glutamate ABC transporter substrate-binding protein [Streptomyces odonnellii]
MDSEDSVEGLRPPRGPRPSGGTGAFRGPLPYLALLLSRRLRGWGGVSAMAAACVLTASLTLLPLSRTVDENAEKSAQRTATAVPATAADECENPQASLPPSGADGPTIERIKARKNRKLVVGVDQNSYRWGYRNSATGELEGFDIDLARAIADNILGDPDAIVFRAIPTNLRIPALQNGTVDLVVRTMTINCDRIQQVAFSTAYFRAGQQVLAPIGSRITGHDSSLSGQRVCTAKGSTAYEELNKQSFGAVFENNTVPNQLDCLVRLQLGEVDAVVTDSALAAGLAAQDPGVELKGKAFTAEYYGVAAKLGNDDLIRRVNQVLVGYRAGGGNSPWMASYKKWLQTDLGATAGPPAPLYK